MILPHNLRPTALKLRGASNFAKLPQNSRIISRIKTSGEKIAKTIVIGLIFAGIAFSQTNYQPIFNNDSLERKQVLSADSNLYLRDAVDHFGKYLRENEEEEQERAIEKLKAFLGINPDNPYALRLVRTLKVNDDYEIDQQISKTLAVLEQRPDYAAAWLRLSILYKQKGKKFLAEDALREAKKYGNGW